MKRWIGFTLVELLVVITIISILIALLLPAISKAREYGRSAKCMSNLKQLHQAVVNYAVDHGSIPSGCSAEAEDKTVSPSKWYQSRTGWIDWKEQPYKHGGDLRTYLSGANAEICITNGTLYPYVKTLGVYVCPTFARQSVCGFKDARRNYVMNSRASGGSITMRGAFRTLLFADGGLTNYVDGVRVADSDLRHYSDSALNDCDGERDRYCDGQMFGGNAKPSGSTKPYPWESIGHYHNGFGNAIFVDGHVEKLHPTNTIDACAGNWGKY